MATNYFSFELQPEQHQPSGTANLSRIDRENLSYLCYTPKMEKSKPK